MASITPLQGSDVIATADSMTKINTNFANLNSDKIETSYIDTDTALTANSDSKIPTQKAVKTYVDAVGAVTPASTTTKGSVEIATSTEAINGTETGDTGAKLVVTPANASMSKRSSTAITATATPTINIDTYNRFVITPDRDITSMSSGITGTPVDGQKIDIQIRNKSGQKYSDLTTIGTSNAYTSSATSLVLSKPSETKQGQIIFALYSSNTGYALTIPTGWTRIAQITSAGLYRELFYKITTSSEPTTYTWTHDSGSVLITLETKSGSFDLVNPIESYSNTAYTYSDAYVRAASVTTTEDNQYVITFSMVGHPSSLTFTPAAGFTETYDFGDTTPDEWHQSSYKLITSAGATGDIDTTASTATNNKHAFAVVLKMDKVYDITWGSSYEDLVSTKSNGINNYELEYNSILSKWVSRQNKTFNSFFGVTTYDLSTASGTKTFQHNLGRIPKVFRIKAVNIASTDANSTSLGISDGTSNSCIYLWGKEGSSTAQADVAGSSDNYCFYVSSAYTTSTAVYGIASFDLDNVTLTLTKVGSPTGTAYILWEVE